MTSKKGHTLRIESEIDKNREEGNWKKVIELAEHLKVQYPSNGKYFLSFNVYKYLCDLIFLFFSKIFNKIL